MSDHVSGGRMLNKAVCFLCRQRKTRCNRNIPECDSCSKAGVECQYVQVKRKPGLRAGYVSTLEERLTKLEKEFQEMKVDGIRAVPAVNVSSSASIAAPSAHVTPDRPAEATSRSVRYTPLDFDPLTANVLNELCAVWFEKYHSWFPILHGPSLMDVLQTAPVLSNTAHYNVFKAIAAVTIPHSYRSDSLTNDQRRQCSEELRGQVVMDSISQLSLQSLQALLILTIRDYGSGRLSECWNLVALAKRMSTQLGYRDMVANYCDNFNQLSTIPPRILPLPVSLVNKEERIRAYWMVEVLDGSSTLGAAWNLNISRPENTALLPCSDTVFTFPEALISVWSFGEAEISSAHSWYVILVTRELWHVHCFLQKTFDTHSATERVRWQTECKGVDQQLVEWRTKFEEAIMQVRAESGNTYDPNVIQTQCIMDLAIISLYQRLALPPAGLEEAQEPWYHAIQRCLDACGDMTTVLRVVDDANLENMNPLIIPCIFVASRFLVVHAKWLNVEIPRNLDLLVYSLKTCGLRWSLARRLERVIRTATAEQKLPSSMSSLPVQFYDLQYSYYDIDESIRIWAEGLHPWMHLAGLEQRVLDQSSFMFPNA
ncbi:hypothetical protein GQ43DRAFT_392578 [Delitschia confertaspora ATCC 74209]|uniref:Zn(2)-C6 fungal-type domain-containing protein n=1 Tax=Delitschia confertaspora ATCC 74209 TaxID=1513339 RepID=A0A9P4JNC0_9PLEO|nr:hypothetical protein GQ43DRAFT_392578 [Delitschia confertaspora ATCC 74209]